jgi:sugar lactone lactonase YvrE
MAVEDSFEYTLAPGSELFSDGDYTCPLTGKVMLDPHLTNCCKCHLSASIAQKLTGERKPCPVCGAASPAVGGSAGGIGRVFSVSKDQVFRDKVLQLKVYCPHSVRGCVWVGHLKDVQSHALSCDQQPWKCQYCGLETTQYAGTTKHAKDCQKRPVQCTICTHQISFCEYEDHLKTCPSQIIPCEFKYVGCHSEVLRKNMPQHLEGSISQHQLLVSQESLKMMTKLSERLDEGGVLEASGKSMEGGYKSAMKLKDQRTRRRSSPTQRHFLRLQSQIDEQEEEIQYCGSPDSVSIELLQGIVENLRHKKSMGEKEISNLVLQLEDVLAENVEAGSVASNEGCCLSESGRNPSFCRGKLERVVISGLKKPWGLAVSGGRLYVVDNGGKYGLRQISILDQNSSAVPMIASASISDITIPPGKCWYPRGVAVDKDGNIILLDSGTHRVLKFSPVGKLLTTAGSESVHGNTSGAFFSPTGAAINPEGKIYICDCYNHRIQVLGPELEFLEEFGEHGKGNEQFTNPWDVAFDMNMNVYVADCGNCCVKVFTPDHKFSRVIGKGEGKYKKGDLRAPSSVCIHKEFLYVTDLRLKRVLVYNIAGDFKCSFGKFTKPHGIAVDEDGRVYVSDNGGGGVLLASGQVQMFS